MDRQKILSSSYITSQAHKHSSAPTNTVMRQTMRRIAHKELMNEIYSNWVDLYLGDKCTGRNAFAWWSEFIDFSKNLEHPKFSQFIKSKVHEHHIADRAKHVRDIMIKMSHQEVSEFCYGMTEDATNYVATHVEEIVRKQEVIKLSKDEILPSLLLQLENVTVVDGTHPVEDYIENGGIVSNEISDTFLDPEDVQPIPEVPFRAGATRFEDRIEDVAVCSLEDVKTNNVFECGNKRYTGKSFPIVMYAPPHSGKTTYNKQVRSFLDTDSMFLWQQFESKGAYLTNMPNLIDKGVFTISIIPTRDEFFRRCRTRGLTPTDEWYTGMINDTKHSNCKILSNKYLSDLACISVRKPP